jgi:hypothetical protein
VRDLLAAELGFPNGESPKGGGGISPRLLTYRWTEILAKDQEVRLV